MTMLFTSFVCDTCNPADGIKLVWRYGYAPLYKGQQKQLDGIYLDTLFSTPEKAYKYIEEQSYDPKSNLWSLMKVKSTRTLSLDDQNTGDYIYRVTKNPQRVVRREREEMYNLPYVHLVEVIK
jgi:hypothetical protein